MSLFRRYCEGVCGRYVIAQDVDAYARFFGVDSIRTEMLEANYNVAPTDSVYAVVDHDDARLLGSFRWGLIPFWAEVFPRRPDQCPGRVGGREGHVPRFVRPATVHHPGGRFL